MSVDFRKELFTALASGQALILVRTDEPDDALATLEDVCTRQNWHVHVWDRLKGTRQQLPRPAAGKPAAAPTEPPSVIGALRWFAGLKNQSGASKDNIPTVLSMYGFQFGFMGRADEVHAQLLELNRIGKANFKWLVGFISPDDAVPRALQPLFHVIDHQLPRAHELAEVLKLVKLEDEPAAESMTQEEIDAATSAALGLTRLQAENAFAMSLRSHNRIDPADIWRRKVALLNSERLLTVHEGGETFADVGGLDGAKQLVTQLLKGDGLSLDDPDVRPRGIIALGPPGTGKSLFAKCLGNEVGWPVVQVNIGRLMGGLVGQTEANTRRMFQLLRLLAPVVAIIDEFGKQMPSTTGQQHTSDVANRVAAEFLAQMNDLQEQVFWVLTENDVSHMDRGFTRAERIDFIFHVGTPGPVQRAQIWGIYTRKFFPAEVKGKPYPFHLPLDVKALLAEKPPQAARLAAAVQCLAGKERTHALKMIGAVSTDLEKQVKELLINDENWTPAEIRSCARLARLMCKPFHDVAHLVGHVALGDTRRSKRILRWCEANGAVDMETGQPLLKAAVPAEEDEAPSTGRPRRRVRTSNKDNGE